MSVKLLLQMSKISITPTYPAPPPPISLPLLFVFFIYSIGIGYLCTEHNPSNVDKMCRYHM